VVVAAATTVNVEQVFGLLTLLPIPEIRHVNVSSQPRVVSKIPTVVVRVLIDNDLI